MTPTETEEDWAAIARAAARGAGRAGGLPRVPRARPGAQAVRAARARPRRFVGQLTEWVGHGRRRAAAGSRTSPPTGPDALRAELDEAARAARPRPWWSCATGCATCTPRPSRARRTRSAASATPAGRATSTAPTWTWTRRTRTAGPSTTGCSAEMKTEAEKILPGAGTPWEALRAPRRARRAHRGRRGGPRLAAGPDGRGDRGAGRHALRTRRAGPEGGVPDRPARRRGGAVLHGPVARTSPVRAAPGCRRWAQTRFPVYDLVSTWYHEGVPGHHLQLAQWVHVADQLSRYQATVGMVSANAEGWALYAERLMDELGFLTDAGAAARLPGRADDAGDPGHRRHRHAPGAGDPGGLALPPGRALDAGAGAGVLRHAQRPSGGLRGERADPLPGACRARPSATSSASAPGCWAGRTRAAAHGDAFDAKAWHMAALSQGSLGLDDLVDELSQL